MATIDWAQIIVDPLVSRGRERAIRGTGISVSAVLHLLSFMSGEDEVISYVSSFSGLHRDRDLTREDVRVCAAYAARLVRNRQLSPPAAARFTRDQQPVGGSTEEDIRLWAPIILDDFSNGLRRHDILRDHEELTEEIIQGALAYASALASDEDLSPVTESAQERYLRDLLSAEDVRLVDAFCKYYSSTGLVLMVPTPEDWFSRWKRTVERVEHVYAEEIHELRNDLDARDLLEDLISMFTPSGQQRIRAVVQPWDARYEATTRVVATSLMGNEAPWRPRRWWWYRVPVRFGPTLANDLNVLGIGGERQS